ncbi:MAG: hypothetical protein ACR2P0_08005 [Acidimicrobiales bacterium]
MSIRTHLTATLTIILGIAFWATPFAESAASATPPDVESSPLPPAETFGTHGADAELERIIEDVTDMYEAAGLGLPPLNIHVHPNTDACNGAPGLYSKGGDPHRVDLCIPSRALVVHELAHAWEYHNVDDETRAAFMAETGASEWNSYELPHPARGVEQFAHAIEWGLKPDAIQPMLMAHFGDKLDLFELATGMPSPRVADVESGPIVVRRPTVSGSTDRYSHEPSQQSNGGLNIS